MVGLGEPRTTGKTVGKDLVKDRVSDPVWGIHEYRIDLDSFFSDSPLSLSHLDLSNPPIGSSLSISLVGRILSVSHFLYSRFLLHILGWYDHSRISLSGPRSRWPSVSTLLVF